MSLHDQKLKKSTKETIVIIIILITASHKSKVNRRTLKKIETKMESFPEC